MAPVKRRRRLPTLVNRGLGLLEVILPGRGGQEGEPAFLPPGQRDASGFWFPAQCARPGDIFTERQRRLQAKQRAVQKRRGRRRAQAPTSPPAAGKPSAAGKPLAAGKPSVAGEPPAAGEPRSAAPGGHPAAEGSAPQAAERSMPLPSPLAEAGGSLRPRTAPLPSTVTHTLLSPMPDAPPPRVAFAPRPGRVPLVVDSGEGSE